MMNKPLTEQEQVDRLDAYIDHQPLVMSEVNPSEDDGTRTPRPQAAEMAAHRPNAIVADALRKDATDIHAARPFVASLSEQLRERYATRKLTIWQRFARALSTQCNPKGKTMTRLTWGLTVLTTVIVTLATVVLSQPRALPAERILAHAAEATLRQPGRVEHIVVETQFDNVATGEKVAYIIADWQRIDTTLDGHLTISEHTSARYAGDDDDLTLPLSWTYETWSTTCFLDLTDVPTIYRDPGTDEHGCIMLDQAARIFTPSWAGQIAADNPQAWISRLQTNTDALAYHAKNQFAGRPVYSLVEQRGGNTLTLYIDRETYQPVGFIAQTPDYTLTQIVHQYEILNAEDLAFDPFAWPPTTLAEGFQASPRP